MSKRIVRLTTLVMMLSILAACGGSTTGSQTSAPTGAAPTTAAEAPTTAAEAPTTAEVPTTAASETMMPSETMMAETAAAGETTTAGSMAPVSGQLTIAGSSALLPLMQEAANQFQATNPDAQITVTAGGSGAGRTQVCEGKINIGNSDVPLSDEEKTNLNCADAVETPVAIQAFAPVANKTGPGSVTSLTKDQVVGIFAGTITNWSEVGGDDQEIVLINRAKGSGTRSNMAKFLFAGDDAKFATGASEEDNSETVRQTVAQTPGAVSYLSFAYLQDQELTAFSIDGVAPNVADIQSGAWKIGGPGYSITKGQPSEIAAAFLAFVTGPEFQKSDALSTLGFVPISK